MHESTVSMSARPVPHVADLHCDLLAYLALDADRTVDDPASRCSLPQLRAGGVGLQTLAIFTLTNEDAVRLANLQATAFRDLVRSRRNNVSRVADDPACLVPGTEQGTSVGVVAAIENASGLCDEAEPLERGLARLDAINETVGGLLYVSLTWNQANRFGGGCGSEGIGLRDDGRVLLDRLAARGIAIDLSHASATLADDVLNHIDARGLDLPVCASHSCFQAKNPLARNLPDDIARGIAARNGVIGLNFLRVFLSDEDSVVGAFAAQIEHANALGISHAHGFGADFFCAEDVPASLRAAMPNEYFFPESANAACYPALLEGLTAALTWDSVSEAAFAHGNVEAFVRRVFEHPARS